MTKKCGWREIAVSSREVKVYDRVILYKAAHLEGVLCVCMWYHMTIFGKSVSLLWYASSDLVCHSTTSAMRPLTELTAVDALAVDGQTVSPLCPPCTSRERMNRKTKKSANQRRRPVRITRKQGKTQALAHQENPKPTNLPAQTNGNETRLLFRFTVRVWTTLSSTVDVALIATFASSHCFWPS